MTIPKELDPNECKHIIRFLNGTDISELNQYSCNGPFTYFTDQPISFQTEIERKQNPFTVTQLNTEHQSVFTYQPNIPDWIPEKNGNPHSRCSDEKEYLTDRDSWSLTLEELSLDYDDKRNKLINEGETPPCLHSDGFCKPTVKHPYTIVWFPEKICLVFHVSKFIGRMSKINDRYYIETMWKIYFNISLSANTI